MDFDYNQFKLSKYVDDFLVDNINNMASDFPNIQHINDVIDPLKIDNFLTRSEYCDEDIRLCPSSHIDKLNIEQYFPWKPDINYNNLKIDDIGKFSITLPKKADSISRIINSYCNNFNRQLIITDATAGAGGNVLSFCKYNYKVNAIEIDEERYKLLQHNITEYGYSVNILNCDYLTVYEKLQQDIIFVDPPWGGINYKTIENITLKLGDISIEELCNKISEKKLAKFTVLKLPFNYNLNHIKSVINLPFTLFKLKNIIIIIVFNII